MKDLLARLPAGQRFIEPFVGAGSVFLAATFKQYVINDLNPDLIAVWTALQNRPRDFMERAAALFCREKHSAAAYGRIRARFNEESISFERAVLLPYLNRFGFNGLFRVNRHGEFNVPYGAPRSLPLFPWLQMEAAVGKLASTVVLSGGFLAAMEMSKAGDVVYCDPPYAASARGTSFTGYTSRGFTLDDHRQLAEAAVAASARGAKVLISNHDTPATRELYGGWHIEPLDVRRSVAALPSARIKARELIASPP